MCWMWWFLQIGNYTLNPSKDWIGHNLILPKWTCYGSTYNTSELFWATWRFNQLTSWGDSSPFQPCNGMIPETIIQNNRWREPVAVMSACGQCSVFVHPCCFPIHDFNCYGGSCWSPRVRELKGICRNSWQTKPHDDGEYPAISMNKMWVKQFRWANHVEHLPTCNFRF